MFKKLYVRVFLVISLCIPVATYAQSEYKYYFANYHPESVEYEANGQILNLGAGQMTMITSIEPIKSIRIIKTNKSYRIEKNKGNIFYWHWRKKQVECRANSDAFLGYTKRIKATIVNTTSQRVTVYWAGNREVFKPRYESTVTYKSYFNPGLYIYQSGSVYIIPSGKHKMFWNDRLNKVSIDVNHYY